MRRTYFAPLFVLTGVSFLSSPFYSQTGAPAPGKSALLIGISTYDHAASDIKVPDGAPPTGRFEPAITYPDLKGPKFDVQAMKGLLMGARFGFTDEKRIHILLDENATRAGILAAMQKYLVEEPQPGDTAVLYISSHGSVRVDPKGHGDLFAADATGKSTTYLENTIVPYDWYTGADDIFSRDLRHIFNLAAARGIHVTAIFDSCHSGSFSRGSANPAIVARQFAIDPRPMPADPYPGEATGTPPQERADAPTLILSAAQKDQNAADVQNGSPPYGLFTHALIDTLQALPPNRPAEDIFRRLQISMELVPDGASHQQPAVDASPARRTQPLFGGEASTGPATGVVVDVDSSGALLDIGSASDVGPGTEFAPAGSAGSGTTLRVTDSVGLTRSRATVTPAGGVKRGDVVQVKKWVPAERPTLAFFAGPSLPLAQIQKALDIVAASGFKLAADPSLEAWTHRVFWDGAKWIAEPNPVSKAPVAAKPEKPMVLGANIPGGALRKLAAGSVLWFNAPFPAEAANGFFPKPNDDGPLRAAALTADRSQALYVLTGAGSATALQYAWFNRSDLDGGVQTPKDISAGCSPDSPYPLRTDWAPATATKLPGSALTDSAVQLSRLNGWLKLEASSLSGQTGFSYKLAVRRDGEQQDLVEGSLTYPEANPDANSKYPYALSLAAIARSGADPRWVYVLAIDCRGKGVLLWPPEDGQPSSYPKDNAKLDRIALPDSSFGASVPYGTDTYLLLTTSNPITDTSALKFDGVVTRGGESKGPNADPLEDLLDSTSAGTRSTARPAPSNWSISVLRLQSRPTAPAKGANQ